MSDISTASSPAYSIRVVPHIKSNINSVEASGICRRKRRLIEIRRDLREDDAISTLLHEMAHARTVDHHGIPWKREMIRLREAGAPLTAPDRALHLDDLGGSQVTKRMFRAHVDDLLCDPDLKLTLPQVIRLFISNVGGPPTIAAFKKKCPWAGAEFREAKREFADYMRLQAE